jgi:endonuclease/exonuclease/phosphatase family metal-dependent hydrolase
MRRRLTILIPVVIAILYIWQNRIEVENIHLSPSLSEQYDDSILTVVTYNIRGCRDNEGQADSLAIAEELEKLGADVIALQEVDNGLPRSHFINQARTIARYLNMNYVYAPSINFLIGTYGNAVISNRPVLSSRVVPLPSSLEPRTLLDVIIELNGSPFHVYTTHLGLKKSERVEQFQYLREYLRTNAAKPAVFLGDLNTRSTDPLLASLRTLFHDPLFAHHQKLITVSGRSTYGMIDHVFLSDDLRFEHAFSPSTGRSDHYPIRLKLHLPQRKKAFAP